MTVLGWIFLVASTAFVWGLTGWCFYKVLSFEDPPAEEVQQFRSA